MLGNSVRCLFGTGVTNPVRHLNMASNQVTFKYRGYMAGAFTPFNDDLSVNLDIIPKYAKWLSDSGVPGVLVNGTTSQGACMTVQERKSLAEVWVSAAKETKQHIMIQVGGCPLPDVQELARHAEKIGANSLLTLPELYFKPKTAQELIDYLKLISEAAPNTPLLFYHNPVRTGVDINMEEFLKLSVGQIPTFQGIKFATGDLSAAYEALKAAEGRYAVFLAVESLLQPALALGFDSFSTVSLTIFPEHYHKIVQAMKENRVEDARVIQDKLTAACKVMKSYGESISTMKVGMNAMTPIPVGVVRPPLKNISKEQQTEMATKLKEYVL